MGDKIKNEYSCSECNATVQEEDEICLNCGAVLNETITPAKFTKTKHRVLFYILVPPIISFLGLFLYFITKDAHKSLFPEFYISTIPICLSILLIITFIANILFGFLFINCKNKTRLLIAASLSVLYICIYIFAYFTIGISGISGLLITLLFLIMNESAIVIFNKSVNKKILQTAVAAFLLCGAFAIFETLDNARIEGMSRRNLILQSDIPSFLEKAAHNKDEMFYSIIHELRKAETQYGEKDICDLIVKKFSDKQVSPAKYFTIKDGSSQKEYFRQLIKKTLAKNVDLIRDLLSLISKKESSIKLVNDYQITVETNINPAFVKKFLSDSILTELRPLKSRTEVISILQIIDSVLSLRNNKINNSASITENILSKEEFSRLHPLFSIAMVSPNSFSDSNLVDIYVDEKNLDSLHRLLKDEEIRSLIPDNMEFIIAAKPFDYEKDVYFGLYSVDRQPILTGRDIQFVKRSTEQLSIDFEVDPQGFQKLDKNIPNNIAIEFDGRLFSEPLLFKKVANSKYRLSGIQSLEEAQTVLIFLIAHRIMMPFKVILPP